MNRREFLGGTALGLIAGPRAGEAQAPAKVPRIGVLGGTPPEVSSVLKGFFDRLRELGYVEGQNVVIEGRYYGDQLDRLPALAAELVRIPVDVIVAGAAPAPEAARGATSTIPIVMAALHPDLDVVFPVHLNPVVHAPVHSILGACPNVRLMSPLDYLAMQQVLADAYLVLTDSGGLQEEAPTFGVPLLVLREETERPEAVEAGCAVLVGTTRRAIVAEVERLWHDQPAYRQMQRVGNPFGDGLASRRIVTTVERHLSTTKASPFVAA